MTRQSCSVFQKSLQDWSGNHFAELSRKVLRASRIWASSIFKLGQSDFVRFIDEFCCLAMEFNSCRREMRRKNEFYWEAKRFRAKVSLGVFAGQRGCGKVFVQVRGGF